MKKLLSLLVAAVMVFSLAACGSNNNATNDSGTSGGETRPAPVSDAPSGDLPPASVDSGFSGDVTLEVMLMPAGEMSSAAIKAVSDALTARVRELGYEFSVNLSMSGGAWGFDDLNMALQTASAPDIIPAHSWSGDVHYDTGALTGQYLRLDHPDNNLMEKYGNIYINTSPAIRDVSVVPGAEGTGIYGVMIDKDSASQIGYMVNKTYMEEIGLSVSDFNPTDLASWEPVLAAYKAEKGGYPLNIEGEVLARAATNMMYYSGTSGPLGIQFDNNNPAATNVTINSRYEVPEFKAYIDIMHGYYTAGYVDPDQGIVGEVSSESVATRRNTGDYLITTFVYGPGQEMVLSAQASDAQGRDIEIVWMPSYKTPIVTPESAMGAGMAVYSGTSYAAEAVTFLYLWATDSVIADLLVAGVEGESWEMRDGLAWYINERNGYNMWRWGFSGAGSAATPLGDQDADGNEWKNFVDFNASAATFNVPLFSTAPVDAAHSACVAVIDKYSVPLGSGAMDPDAYYGFIDELKAAGLQEVLDEAHMQLDAWLR